MRIEIRAFFVTFLGLVLCWGLGAASARKTTPAKQAKAKSTAPAVRTSRPATTVRASARKKTTPRRYRRKRVYYSPWTEPTFADSAAGDSVDGEDLVVRRAAVEALGPYNGSVVVADPHTGRLLSIVNQKLALKSGFQPCSTIKVPVALAALMEGIIERDTMLRIYRRKRLNLTEALAMSNNPFFANLGMKLGFDRVNYYARLFGLGEKAGLNIDGEQPGVFPEAPPPNLSVGLMSSFGEGIRLTPLQLAALLSAIANGGTLYYLQYPRSIEDADAFVPRVKRRLEIEPWIPDIKPGMMAAVEHGTARRANYDPTEPILGKTGTCTEDRTHLGWFGSFNDVGRNKLVVVVLLTGGRGVSGPTAAQIAGGVYKRLSEENFFALSRPYSPSALVSTQSCCAQ
jgi:cell division protein FtsI/penicillin-binding protein 2